MAYDRDLASRLRMALAGEEVEEKAMFGGLSFLLGGRMAAGVIGEDLVVPVGPEAYAEALERPHARPMDFTGRPMRGWVYVARPGWEAKLQDWLALGLAYARSRPEKKRKRGAP